MLLMFVAVVIGLMWEYWVYCFCPTPIRNNAFTETWGQLQKGCHKDYGKEKRNVLSVLVKLYTYDIHVP